MLTCSICKTRKRGNCECIATCWSQTSHFPLWLRHHAKFEVAEPTRYCRIISFLLLIQYFTLSHWPLTFDLKHLQRIACDVMKLCTKFEHNRAIRGGVIAISVFDLMTLNIALRVASYESTSIYDKPSLEVRKHWHSFSAGALPLNPAGSSRRSSRPRSRLRRGNLSPFWVAAMRSAAHVNAMNLIRETLCICTWQLNAVIREHRLRADSNFNIQCVVVCIEN